MKFSEVARITHIGGKPLSYWTRGIVAMFDMQQAKYEAILKETRTFCRIEMLDEDKRIRNYDKPLMLPEGRSCSNHE